MGRFVPPAGGELGQIRNARNVFRGDVGALLCFGHWRMGVEGPQNHESWWWSRSDFVFLWLYFSMFVVIRTLVCCLLVCYLLLDFGDRFNSRCFFIEIVVLVRL